VRFLSDWILGHSGPQQVKVTIKNGVYQSGYSPCSTRCSTKLLLCEWSDLLFSCHSQCTQDALFCRLH